jgi:hypothetical protein
VLVAWITPYVDPTQGEAGVVSTAVPGRYQDSSGFRSFVEAPPLQSDPYAQRVVDAAAGQRGMLCALRDAERQRRRGRLWLTNSHVRNRGFPQ